MSDIHVRHQQNSPFTASLQTRQPLFVLHTHSHKPLISIHNCVKKHNTLKHTFLHTDPRFVRPVSVHVCVSFLLSLAACFSQSFSPCFFFYIFKFFNEIFYVELATNDTLLPGVVLFGIVCMSLILRS